MLKTKIVAFLGLALTLSSLLMGSRTLGFQRAVLSLQLGGLLLVLGGFFLLFDKWTLSARSEVIFLASSRNNGFCSIQPEQPSLVIAVTYTTPSSFARASTAPLLDKPFKC